jgi:predicted transcriptional regulator of viral defense system
VYSQHTAHVKASPRPHEDTVLRLARKRGLLRARDVAALNLPTVVLTRLVRAGKLERAGRGVYVMAGAPGSAQRSLAEVALRAPRAVICLLSALRVHEVGTQSPFQVWIALPPGATPPKIEFPLRIVRMSGASLTEGIGHIKIDGVDVPVFNTAKTIADCFKFRNKVGLDVALEALREGWRERKVTKVTMDALWHFGTVNRVANVMRPYLEGMV